MRRTASFRGIRRGEVSWYHRLECWKGMLVHLWLWSLKGRSDADPTALPVLHLVHISFSFLSSNLATTTSQLQRQTCRSFHVNFCCRVMTIPASQGTDDQTKLSPSWTLSEFPQLQILQCALFACLVRIFELPNEHAREGFDGQGSCRLTRANSTLKHYYNWPIEERCGQGAALLQRRISV